MRYELHLGDCIETMRSLPDNSVDSVVTDPPYGIRFMGKSWDGADIEARRAQRCGIDSHDKSAGPNGGHRSLAAEAGKYDLTLTGMLAFQDFSREWATEALRILKPGGHLVSFSSPRTYHRMAVGIEMSGFEIRDQIMWVFGSGFPKSHNLKGEHTGWGTALKPSHEPVCLARKPFKGTVAANVLEWGTGAINIDGARVQTDDNLNGGAYSDTERKNQFFKALDAGAGEYVQPSGRWPANLIHDGSDEPTELLGAAARFFYCAKASKKDRDEGLDGFEKRANIHPTVKPTDLMAYLCRLVTPPGGVVLDPFMGSGSTGKAVMREGFRFIGIEREPEYMEIAEKRIEHEAKKFPVDDFSDLI